MILNIKPAARYQIEDICVLSDAHGREFFEESMRSGLLTAVVTCDRAVKGVCVCRSSPIPDGCEITALFIEQERRGKGIGRKLLSYALREMRAQRFTRAFIWLDENNSEAAGFLTHFGFTFDGKERKAPSPDGSAMISEMRFRIDI